MYIELSGEAIFTFANTLYKHKIEFFSILNGLTIIYLSKKLKY